MRLYLIIVLINFLTYFLSFSQSFEKPCSLLEISIKSKNYFNRPELSGPEYIVVSNNFIVHYTLEGCDATTQEYANLVLEFAEYSRNIQVNQMDWFSPLEDGNRGGDNRYDIYILCRRHVGANGRCVPEIFDTLSVSAASFIIIVNDLNTNIKRLQSAVAHEFNHACQFAYTYKDFENNGGWFYENTASWMENITFRENFDFLRYINEFDVNPITKPGLGIENSSDGYHYGGFLWPRFLTEWKNDLNLIRKIWEKMKTTIGSTIKDIENVLKTEYSTNLSEALREYAVWRYFTGSRAITNRFFSISNLITVETPISYSFNGYPNNGNLTLKGIGSAGYIEFSWDILEDIISINFNGIGNSKTWALSIIETRDPYEFTLTYEVLLDSNNKVYVLSNPRNNKIILVPVITEIVYHPLTCYFSSSILLDKKAIKFMNIYGYADEYEHLGGEFF